MSTSSVLHALETAADVAIWRAKNPGIVDEIVVALTPEASQALEGIDVAHKTVEDFYSEGELCTRAEKGCEVTRALCEALDKAMGIAIGDGLPPFSAHYYAGQLRVLYGNFLRASFMMRSMLDALEPSRVVLVTSPQPDASNIMIVDSRFLSRVLTEIMRQKGISFETFLCTPDAEIQRTPLSKKFKNALRRCRDALRAQFPAQGDIAYHIGVKLPERELAQKGLRVFPLPSCHQPSVEGEISDFFAVAGFFKFDGIDLNELARPSLVAFTGTFRNRHLAFLKRTEKVLVRSGAHAVVSESARQIEPVSALLAARRVGIPAVVIQHGGLGGYCLWDMIQFIDVNINNDFFAYGEGVIETIRPLANATNKVRDHQVRMHAIGASQVWDIRQNCGKTQNRSRLCALYVTNPLGGSASYMGGQQRPDFLYWRTKREVLRTMVGHSADWDVHFRPPPNIPDLALTGLSADDREKVTLRRDDGLVSILENETFDLIVIDTLATSLLQCLATQSRIVTWIDPLSMQFSPGSIEMLKRRADVSEAPEDYVSCISQAMNEKQRPGPVDDGFLLRYSLAGEENPDDLTANALAQIVAGKAG